MPTERIGDVPESKASNKWVREAETCHDPDHSPANMIVRPHGRYKHTCPSCGKVSEFTVMPTSFSAYP